MKGNGEFVAQRIIAESNESVTRWLQQETEIKVPYPRLEPIDQTLCGLRALFLIGAHATTALDIFSRTGDPASLRLCDNAIEKAYQLTNALNLP